MFLNRVPALLTVLSSHLLFYSTTNAALVCVGREDMICYTSPTLPVEPDLLHQGVHGATGVAATPTTAASRFYKRSPVLIKPESVLNQVVEVKYAPEEMAMMQIFKNKMKKPKNAHDEAAIGKWTHRLNAVRYKYPDLIYNNLGHYTEKADTAKKAGNKEIEEKAGKYRAFWEKLATQAGPYVTDQAVVFLPQPPPPPAPPSPPPTNPTKMSKMIEKAKSLVHTTLYKRSPVQPQLWNPLPLAKEDPLPAKVTQTDSPPAKLTRTTSLPTRLKDRAPSIGHSRFGHACSGSGGSLCSEKAPVAATLTVKEKAMLDLFQQKIDKPKNRLDEKAIEKWTHRRNAILHKYPSLIHDNLQHYTEKEEKLKDNEALKEKAVRRKIFWEKLAKQIAPGAATIEAPPASATTTTTTSTGEIPVAPTFRNGKSFDRETSKLVDSSRAKSMDKTMSKSGNRSMDKDRSSGQRSSVVENKAKVRESQAGGPHEVTPFI